MKYSGSRLFWGGEEGGSLLLTYISLMSKQREEALFASLMLRPSRSYFNQFSALPSTSFSSSHMMWPTLPSKNSPAASGLWLTLLYPVFQTLQSLTLFPLLTSPASCLYLHLQTEPSAWGSVLLVPAQATPCPTLSFCLSSLSSLP